MTFYWIAHFFQVIIEQRKSFLFDTFPKRSLTTHFKKPLTNIEHRFFMPKVKLPILKQVMLSITNNRGPNICAWENYKVYLLKRCGIFNLELTIIMKCSATSG